MQAKFSVNTESIHYIYFTLNCVHTLLPSVSAAPTHTSKQREDPQKKKSADAPTHTSKQREDPQKKKSADDGKHAYNSLKCSVFHLQ